MRDESLEQRKGPEEFEPFLESQQVAELIGVHPETVKRRARRARFRG
jgi:hypothetical protein